jgi:predicted Rossmann-fold nucleotide-binding protein
MGIGMEIMTYIADHYRPPTLQSAVGLFGRSNVVRHADYVLVIGGGPGTLDEIDLAISMGKRMLPFAASGGAARHALERMCTDIALRSWLPEDVFAALRDCATAAAYTAVIEQIITFDLGSAPNE